MPVVEKPTQTRIYEIILPDGSFIELVEDGRILFRPQWAPKEVVVYESIKNVQEHLGRVERVLANLLMINTVYHHAHATWKALDASKEYERCDK